MAKYVVDSESLTAIADAIRAKTGNSASLTLAEMPTEIEGIIADLTVKNTELKAQNDELQTQVWNLTEEKEHLSDEIENLNYTIENLTAENEELQARIEELESGSSSGEPSATLTLSDGFVLTGSVSAPNGWIVEGLYPFKDGTDEDYSGDPSDYYDTSISSFNTALASGIDYSEYVEGLGNGEYKIELVLYNESTSTQMNFYSNTVEYGESGSGGDSGESGGDYEPTDQTALAGAYTDATFTTRAYTWDELLERGDYNNNGGIQPYENPPSAELPGYYYVYGENYAFVIPDTITTGVGTEGCKALVFPSTTTEFKTGMEGTIDTIYIKATTPPTLPWEEYFVDCNYNGSNGGYVNTVVPIGCGNVYKNWTNWSLYADYIEEGEMPI